MAGILIIVGWSWHAPPPGVHSNPREAPHRGFWTAVQVYSYLYNGNPQVMQEYRQDIGRTRPTLFFTAEHYEAATPDHYDQRRQ